jgi:hypothetical protein
MSEVSVSGKKPENMTEVMFNYCAAIVVSRGSYFWIKRKMRKLGAPDWAVWAVPKIFMAINVPRITKQMHLEPEEIGPIVLKWLEDHPDHKLAQYIKVG